MSSESAPEEFVTLEIIRELLTALNDAGIRYCHWKSNDKLHKSLLGLTDLDIYTSPDDLQKFVTILAATGYRLAGRRDDEAGEGVWHHYSLDPQTGRLINLHLHTRLDVGNDHSKNFRLPEIAEHRYLETAWRRDLMPVPGPELDYVVFVLRMTLKHAEWGLVSKAKACMNRASHREWDFLREQVDRERVLEVLGTCFAEVPVELFERCEWSLDDRVSAIQKLAIRRRLQNALAAHAIVPLWRHQLRIFKGMWAVQRQRLLGTSSTKRLRSSRGRLIAIVGGDGSGKTTAVEAVTRWLKQGYATEQIHLGHPKPSLATRIWYRSGRIARRLNLRFLSEGTRLFPGGFSFLTALAVARDRSRVHRRALARVEQGFVIISDRIPIPGLSHSDAPRGPQLDPDGQAAWPWKQLLEVEAGYYKSLSQCDLLIALRVDPEIAAQRVHQRSPEEDLDAVRRRSSEFFEADWSSKGAIVIDAGQPVAAVLLDIQTIIWQHLAD